MTIYGVRGQVVSAREDRHPDAISVRLRDIRDGIATQIARIRRAHPTIPLFNREVSPVDALRGRSA